MVLTKSADLDNAKQRS